jgi:hypothetical protein
MFNQYSIYQWNKPTALLLGEFKEFTVANIKQVKDSIKNTGQVCLQIANADSNTIFNTRKENIKSQLDLHGISYNAKYIIINVPNITTQINTL